MDGNHSSDRPIERFMHALDEATSHQEARLPSYRMIWLKAQWAERREREARIARIRLLIEGGVQALVGGSALLTGIYYWPDIQASLAELASAAAIPADFYPILVMATGLLTVLVSLVGSRLMVRG